MRWLVNGPLVLLATLAVLLGGVGKAFAVSLYTITDIAPLTSSNTGSRALGINNLAIFGVADGLKNKGVNYKDMHMITTVVEHPSVINCFEELESRGVKVTYVGVDDRGFVELKEIENILKPNTVLLSIMYVNNEIGTVNPIREISKIIA